MLAALLFLAPVALAGPSAFISGSPILSPTSPNLAQCLLSPPAFSCENKTEVNTCCLPTQGLILQTQFWDTWTGFEKDGQLLPKKTWSIHGLWPDNCDGSFESYCDFSRQYDPKPDPAVINGETVPVYTGPGVDTFIKAFGRQDLLDYMKKFWVAQGQPSPEFWAHEFSKHATCFTTFDTKCYPKYKQHEEVVNFFDTVIQAYKQYPTYKFLAAKGIVPSNTTTYTLSAVLGALEAATGATPHVGCSASGALNEVWYYSHSFGAPQLGVLKHLNTTFGATCPETGIQYLERTPGSEW
ncbi:ribonuclease T2 [Exidia glandulosa HHB12029]|uniref:ribonuclease T2 n=1 Tax=Exidia glandulosa HHB12029 TaxID=1314781 RepID=A0A165FR72_EXIGL|nr:ribonuclease T2 [Exidia glandulosa HHB12029]